MGRSYSYVYGIWFQKSFQREKIGGLWPWKRKQTNKQTRSIIYVELSTFGTGGISFWRLAVFLKKKKKSGDDLVPRTITHIMTGDLQCFQVVSGTLFKRKWSHHTLVRYLCETRSRDWVREGPEYCSSRLSVQSYSVLWRHCLFR